MPNARKRLPFSDRFSEWGVAMPPKKMTATPTAKAKSCSKAKASPVATTKRAKSKATKHIETDVIEDPPAKRQRRKSSKANPPLPEATDEEKAMNKQFWGRYVKSEPAETQGEQPLPLPAPALSSDQGGDGGVLC